MKSILTAFAFITITCCASAQENMRPVEQLINTTEPALPIVQQWIAKAANVVRVLPCDTTKAKEALYQTQITTRSPMGAVIYTTGGILVDNGWIRILGSGSKELKRSLPEWNRGKTFKEFGETPTFLLVADDAAGGFFALNGGALGTDTGMTYYLSPDTLNWEPLSLTYSEFLQFCFNTSLDDFYTGLRWTTWKTDILKLDGDSVYTFAPFLYTKEGKDINKDERGIVPAEEQYSFNMSVREQLQRNR